MGRSGYSEDIDNWWSLIRYRGAVKSAIRGKRGQRLLKDLILALDSMSDKKLSVGWKNKEQNCECALAVLAKQKHIDVSDLEGDDFISDGEDGRGVAQRFNIAESLAREIVYENDEFGSSETPEQRWLRMRRWASLNIISK